MLVLLVGCGGREDSSKPVDIPVENCANYCQKCTDIFIQNNVMLRCISIAQCDKNPCMTITNESLGSKDGYTTVGRYYSNGYMEVTTLNRTDTEVVETMVHEIGHHYGLPHHIECNNIMTPDSYCTDVRTEFESWQKEYFTQ